jgi:hypothetical protein
MPNPSRHDLTRPSPREGSTPSPPPGGVYTTCTFKRDIINKIDSITCMVILSILLLETF